MKRLNTILVGLILLWSIVSPIDAADKPVVAVCPMHNPTGQGWIDNLGNTVEDVVFLTLALMGRYEILRPDSLPEDLSEEGLLNYAQAGNLDDIIFGECLVTDEGYRFSVSIFDHYKGKITVRAEEDFESLLDSFDAADRLTEALVEGLSGVKVTYGGLTLTLLRDEPYRTEIDGVDVGSDFSGSDKLISGSHTLEFFQDRGKGEILVSRKSIEVEEGKTLRLSDPIPWLTADEEKTLRRLEWDIARQGDERNRAALSVELFEEGRRLTEGDFFSSYRPGLIDRLENWERRYRETPLYDGNDESSVRGFHLNQRPFSFRSSPSRPSVDSRLGEASALLARLLETEPEDRDTVLPETVSITVDGYAEDWEGISSVFNDETGRFLEEHYMKANDELFDGQDIEWVGVAMDNERLYFAIKTVSSEISRRREYRVEITGRNLMVINYRGNERKAIIAEVDSYSWDDSRWFDYNEYQTRFAAGDIVEFSIPRSRVVSYTGSTSWVFRLNFTIQRAESPYLKIDEYAFDAFFPEFYYELRGY